MLMLYVLLVGTKIVHVLTVKFKNRHFIKLVWSSVYVLKQSLSSS